MQHPPLVNIQELHEARQLYHEPNFMEIYIMHTRSSDFNTSNTQIVQADDQFVSTTDVMRILPSKPTVFDIDYVPDTKPEPAEGTYGTSLALTESLGSSLGEIIFPAPVKQEITETAETVQNIISTHSPTCQLHLRITNTLSMRNMSDANPTTNTAPDKDLDWSLDANLPTSIDSTMESRHSQSLSLQERQNASLTDPQASSIDNLHTTSQEDTDSQKLTLSFTRSTNTADPAYTVNDVTENCGSDHHETVHRN